MTKAALLFLGLAALVALPAAAPAQDNPTAIAVNEAVLRQANTIVLRQKLAEARRASQSGDAVTAAKLYQESCELVAKIGSGIDDEAAQAVDGLAHNRLALARDAQSRGDLREAATQAQQVLKVDSNNAAALAFKKQNDQMLAAMKGRIPSSTALEQVPQIVAQKTDAGTLVQDGKLFYEMGKFDEAEAKLNQALAVDSANAAAYYYLNLIQQAKFARESAQHTVDTQKRMAQVEKQWVLPTSKNALPVPNPCATNTLIYTGPGRQAIIAKLDHIRLETVSYEGLPLSEVLRNLSEQSKLRDPEHKGINFLINPNADQSGLAVAAPAAGAPAAPGAPAIDPATGLPAASPAPAGGGGGGGESSEVGSTMIKIPNLADVRLADVLDAIVLVADHPVKYTVQDFAVVFSSKGPETPQLFSRTFKVDPNTFYSGLESVGANSFGGSSGGNSGGGGNGGGGGGGGRSGGGGGGGGNNENNGAVVGIVNAFAGAGGLRGSGGQGGGGGGGGGGQGGAVNPLNNAGGAGGAAGGGGGSVGGNGGLNYITQVTLASTVSAAARQFFTSLGVNLEQPPGKAVFFNDRLGKLFVKATEQDLDTIERAIEMLNEVAPQVHIKARFIEVAQTDNKALGFDWYLGQFNMGNQILANGGTAPSYGPQQGITPGSANPSGNFPGTIASSGSTLINPATTDQLLTGGLRNSGPTLGTITGILTDPNFRVAIHALEQRTGVETLAEPEVTTTSGRQTQMRATKVRTVITGVDTQTSQGSNAGGGGGNGTQNNIPQTTFTFITTPVETGPILDVVPYVLADGYTINMALIPSVTEFLGYEDLKTDYPNAIQSGSSVGTGSALAVASPIVLPDFTVRQVVTTVNVWDNQTVALGGLISSDVNDTKDKVPMIGDLPVVGRLFQSQSKSTVKKNLMIFVTATIVDPAGNRVHSDDDLPFAQNSVPVQPPGAGKVTETVQKIAPPVVKEQE